MSAWQEYVKDLQAGRTQVELAEQVGVDQATVSRWLRGGGAPSAENVVQIARRAGRQPLSALVAAGLLSATEARQRAAARPSLSDLTDDELIDELRRRLRGTESEASSDAATMTTHVQATRSGERTRVRVSTKKAEDSE
jgi:transcriptional regulator with XRE-family HTH domain